MKIDIFITCYNSGIILPYWLRHHQQFADNITIFDNMSTDNSIEIIKENNKKNNINIISFDTGGKMEERTLMEIRNSCWRESKADWVIVCDSDEFIYHPNLINTLKDTNATHIIPCGYEMISENLPTTNGQIYEELKMGFFREDFSKPCIFKPSEVKNINFSPGSHDAKPDGNIITDNDTGIKLLHYKYLNRETLIKRYDDYKIRHSEYDKTHGYGTYSTYTTETINNNFTEWALKCTNIID